MLVLFHIVAVLAVVVPSPAAYCLPQYMKRATKARDEFEHGHSSNQGMSPRPQRLKKCLTSCLNK